MKIPHPYKLMLAKIRENTNGDEIRIKEMKQIISRSFKMKEQDVKLMIYEMKDLGLLKYVNHCNVKLLVRDFTYTNRNLPSLMYSILVIYL